MSGAVQNTAKPARATAAEADVTRSGWRSPISRCEPVRPAAMPATNSPVNAAPRPAPAPCHAFSASATQKTMQNSTLIDSSRVIHRPSIGPGGSPAAARSSCRSAGWSVRGGAWMRGARSTMATRGSSR